MSTSYKRDAKEIAEAAASRWRAAHFGTAARAALLRGTGRRDAAKKVARAK